MAERTGIEWADATWNPWMGCKKVSSGCKNCYMFRDMILYGRDPNTVVRAAHSTFENPLKWAKNGKLRPGARIFTCSWSDFFIEEADPWRDDAWQIIRKTPHFIYLILTKRPERIERTLPSDWDAGYRNVWLLVSCEDQDSYMERWGVLARIQAYLKGISAEPLLSQIVLGDFSKYGMLLPDWVIVGGESDPADPRPTNFEWIRNLRNECRHFGIAFFLKQLGGSRKVKGTWGGRLLDGQEWNGFPDMGGTEP